jgi:thioredoxin reductase (NADPH)
MNVSLSLATPSMRTGEEYDLIVIGGGPAGITTGIYAVRKNLKTLIIEKSEYGGTVNLTSEIENYPGFGRINGPQLAEKFHKHALDLGVKFVLDDIHTITKDGDKFKLKGWEGEYIGKAIVLATGARHRKLGVKGEEEYTGKGVSYCAVCDAPFFKDKVIAIVGGGNTAIKDALYMSEICNKVYVIHRRDQFRADELDVERLKGRDNVEFVLNSTVSEIYGDNLVKGVKVNTKGGERDIPLDGVFIDIGEIPNSELAKQIGVELNERGYIKVNDNQETNVPGVYAAGDVTGSLAQIVVAAAQGAIAAVSAYEYVRKPYWAKK